MRTTTSRVTKKCVEAAAALKIAAPRIAWNDTDGDRRVDVAGMDFLAIPTRDLRRSIAFYRRAFGYRVIEEARDQRGASVLMSAGGPVFLAVHEHGGSGELPLARWSFVVDDLDQARQAVWNLGIPAADGTTEPRRTRWWRAGRSFIVRDPDGHEVELVEHIVRVSP